MPTVEDQPEGCNAASPTDTGGHVASALAPSALYVARMVTWGAARVAARATAPPSGPSEELGPETQSACPVADSLLPGRPECGATSVSVTPGPDPPPDAAVTTIGTTTGSTTGSTTAVPSATVSAPRATALPLPIACVSRRRRVGSSGDVSAVAAPRWSRAGAACRLGPGRRSPGLSRATGVRGGDGDPPREHAVPLAVGDVHADAEGHPHGEAQPPHRLEADDEPHRERDADERHDGHERHAERAGHVGLGPP